MYSIEIVNYIKITCEKLCFDDIPPSYFEIYKYDRDEIKGDLGKIFAYWHYQINQEFENLNSYINRKYNYYHADCSRNLISKISEIRNFAMQFKNSDLEFDINKYYTDLCIECEDFLGRSGSTIPDNFKAVNILYGPIFLFNNSHIENKNKRYELKNIGYGAYADVFKYFDEDYQQYFVLKRLKKDSTNKEIMRFYNEFNLMKSNPYPYIVTVYGINKDKNEYTMEFCPYNLEKFMDKNNTKISYSQRKVWQYNF